MNGVSDTSATAEMANGAGGGYGGFADGAPPVGSYWPQQNGGGILPAEHPSTSAAPPFSAMFPGNDGGIDPMYSPQQQQQSFEAQQQHARQMQMQQQMRLQQQQFMANGGVDPQQQFQQQQMMMMMQQRQRQQQQNGMFSPSTPQQQQQQMPQQQQMNNYENGSGSVGVSPAGAAADFGGGSATAPMTPNFASPGGTPMTRHNASPQKNGWSASGPIANGMTPQQQMNLQQQQIMMEQQRRAMMNGVMPMMPMNGARMPLRSGMPSAFLFNSDMANQAIKDVKEMKKFDSLTSWHYANCQPSTSAAGMTPMMNGYGPMPPMGGMPGVNRALRSPLDAPADYGGFHPATPVNGTSSPAAGRGGASTPGTNSRGTKRKASVQAANSTPSPSFVAHSMGSVAMDGANGVYGDVASRTTPAGGDGRHSVCSAAGGGFFSPKSEADDPLKRIEMMTKQHMDQPPSAKVGRPDSAASAASATKAPSSMPSASREQKFAQLTEIKQKLQLNDDDQVSGPFPQIPGFPMGPPIGAYPNLVMMTSFKPGMSLEQQQQHQRFLRQQQAIFAGQQHQMVGGGGAPMLHGSAGIDPTAAPLNPHVMMPMMMDGPTGPPADSSSASFSGMPMNPQQRMLFQQQQQYRMNMQIQHQQQDEQQRMMGVANGGEPFGAGGCGLPMDPSGASTNGGMMNMWLPGQHAIPQSLTNLDARVPVQKMQYYAPATANGSDAPPTQ